MLQKKERITEILNFLLLSPIFSENTTIGYVCVCVYIYIYKLQNLRNCFLFEITCQAEKHYKQPNILNTTRTLEIKKKFKTTLNVLLTFPTAATTLLVSPALCFHCSVQHYG